MTTYHNTSVTNKKTVLSIKWLLLYVFPVTLLTITLHMYFQNIVLTGFLMALSMTLGPRFNDYFLKKSN